MARCGLAAALLALLASAATASFILDIPHVVTRDGALRGFRRTVGNSSIDIYLGVPFARPPVGELRFSKPQRPSTWTGVRNATWFGPPCPQMSGGRLVGQEDCLYLNVYAPRADAGSGAEVPPRAVMVFIHGGGFVSGSASGYDPTILALAGDVVVVTANYRLGMLGCLRLDGPGDGQVQGNFALWDQRLAVEWVQQNAAVFGGDARAVTVFGESAGARSVSLLALSPVANGLFQRVIAQSGSGSAVRSVYRNTARTTSDALARLNVSAGAPSAADELLSRLRSLDLFTLVSVGSDPSPDWSPVIDGDFLPDDVEKLWSGGRFRRLQHLSGYNSQEGLLFLGTTVVPVAAALGVTSLNSGISQTVLNAVFDSQLQALVPGDTTLGLTARNVYCSHSDGGGCVDDYRRLAIATDFVGDNIFAASVTEFANQRVASGSANATYVYYLDRKRLVNAASFMPQWLRTGALHTDDLALVFGGSRLYALNKKDNVTSTVDQIFPFDLWYGDSTEADLSSTVMQYWTNFAKTGNPNEPIPVDMAWPPYTIGNTSVMLFHFNGTRILPDFVNKSRLDFWHDIVLPKYRASRSKATSAPNGAERFVRPLSHLIASLCVACAAFRLLEKPQMKN